MVEYRSTYTCSNFFYSTVNLGMQYPLLYLDVHKVSEIGKTDGWWVEKCIAVISL